MGVGHGRNQCRGTVPRALPGFRRTKGANPMKVEVLPDETAVARRAAAVVASAAGDAVAARGRFVVAVSGGHTPWQMLRALADKDVSWGGLQIFQAMSESPRRVIRTA